jgi:hypothetical protein
MNLLIYIYIYMYISIGPKDRKKITNERTLRSPLDGEMPDQQVRWGTATLIAYTITWSWMANVQCPKME